MEEEYVKSLLDRIDPGCKIGLSTFINVEKYTVEVKTKFSGDYESECKQWIKKYSVETHTDWIVSYTYPNLKQLDFRKDFVCQHSSRNKSRSSSRLRNRNFNCQATLVVKIRKITKDTKKKDLLIREGFNTSIKIVSHHNHAIHVAEAYSFLRISDDIKAAFIEYFNQGLSPAAAKTYHETCLLATTSEDGALKVLADGHKNPIDRSIYHLYNVWRSKNFGDRTIKSMIDIIKSKQKQYSENDVHITLKEDPFIVCILTPLMKRAHHETFSNEIVFIDTTGSCDQTGSNITFMFGASKVGAIPLGCVIHNSQNEKCYINAFMALKETITQCGFLNKSPSVIMTDDSSAERNALSKVFPTSKLLLCSFHVCQAMWRWLWDTNHGIENMHRKSIMLMFRQIVFERDVTACEELMKEFLLHHLVLKYPLLQEHFTQFWERKTEWCICYRSMYLTRGHNTNNIVEVSIRIFKDNVLQRSKSFNTVATIDFVSNQLEQHYVRRLRTYALSRKTNLDLLHRQFCVKATTLQVEKLNNCTFHVTSSDNMFVYVVHSDIEMCNCPAGQGGAFCKHMCAVELNEKIYLKNSPKLSFEDRICLAKLSEGKEIDESFFQNMTESSGFASESPSTSKKFQQQRDEQFLKEGMVYTESRPSSVDDKCNEEIVKLENITNSFINMVKNNPSTHMGKMLNIFNKKMDQLVTPTAFFDFCLRLSKQKKSSGRKILVQPTSISRRNRQRTLTCGSRRIQSGRPSKEETKKQKNKKIS